MEALTQQGPGMQWRRQKREIESYIIGLDEDERGSGTMISQSSVSASTPVACFNSFFAVANEPGLRSTSVIFESFVIQPDSVALRK